MLVVPGAEGGQQRDQERRQARVAKAEAQLERVAAVKRKKVDPQKLASQVGRMLQRLKAHKYFEYAVDAQGQLQWSQREDLIKAERNRDGLYISGTNASREAVSKEGALGHYKNLLEVEDAFCHLKDYLRVRPVFHLRPDRVRNHVRTCFLAYWLTAKLERRWRQHDETIEVHNLLRQLQSIRLGHLKAGDKTLKTECRNFMEMSLFGLNGNVPIGAGGRPHPGLHVETLTMSRKERNRITIMAGVKAKELNQVQAAELLGVSHRQAKRIWRRYQDEGDAGLVHRLRGKPGLRCKAPGLRAQVMARWAEERYADFRADTSGGGDGQGRGGSGSRHSAALDAGGGQRDGAAATPAAPAMAGAQTVLWSDGATGWLPSRLV